MTATRNLGFRYLWIDSVCIVQDDEEDWAREATLMYKVYANAECNLAAAASRDSSGGLFFKRTGLHGQCVAQNHAWVHQEWLMSKRTVQFARNQVFWECDYLCACEVFPDGLPYCIRYDGKKNLAEDLGNATCLMRRDINADTSRVGPDLIQLWSGLITNYTGGELTKSSDWLPALSGIAKWLQPHLGNPGYLAGLWNNSDLHRQLAWFSCTTTNPRPQYRDAGWSWALIDGRILWINPPRIFTPQSEIIDISTTRGGSDPTGPVIGGHILIKGSLGRVQVIDHKAGPILCREDEIKETYGGPVTFRGFDVSGLQFGLYYVLLLGTCTTDPDKIHSSLLEDDYLLATYLVLRPVIGQHGTFERCGLVSECYTEDDETMNIEHSRAEGHRAGKIYPAKSMPNMKELTGSA
ncbi:hypothetical protein FOMG_13387 [Fusarium oxysporum f. sp. melonis 26406]|uniref:Heterokaryon incompatibility domain-containing protein n=1 Tax=Fusarium oxysporum f. sp. melonis 26406 TaxID=1089452 RepID=W9ZQP2_FUSOX|nr:hypothetical protein FOMG_13387 [Fusarium oxysporum f. sp. melonis 26406]